MTMDRYTGKRLGLNRGVRVILITVSLKQIDDILAKKPKVDVIWLVWDMTASEIEVKAP